MILANLGERSDTSSGRVRGTPGHLGGLPVNQTAPIKIIIISHPLLTKKPCSPSTDLLQTGSSCHACSFVCVSMPSFHQKTCLPVNQNLICNHHKSHFCLRRISITSNCKTRGWAWLMAPAQKNQDNQEFMLLFVISCFFFKKSRIQLIS